MIPLGSRWRDRRGRIAVIVAVPSGPAHRRRVRYRFRTPRRTRPTLYRRPYVSTRSETPERFVERFRRVRR